MKRVSLTRVSSRYVNAGPTSRALETEIEGYDHTVSALHFPAGRPLPRLLVKKLIDARLAQIREHARD
jgi:uncharacterized protein YdhG (YjbR/CyaY superfamily)